MAVRVGQVLFDRFTKSRNTRITWNNFTNKLKKKKLRITVQKCGMMAGKRAKSMCKPAFLLMSTMGWLIWFQHIWYIYEVIAVLEIAAEDWLSPVHVFLGVFFNVILQRQQRLLITACHNFLLIGQHYKISSILFI